MRPGETPRRGDREQRCRGAEERKFADTLVLLLCPSAPLLRVSASPPLRVSPSPRLLSPSAPLLFSASPLRRVPASLFPSLKNKGRVGGVACDLNEFPTLLTELVQVLFERNRLARERARVFANDAGWVEVNVSTLHHQILPLLAGRPVNRIGVVRSTSPIALALKSKRDDARKEQHNYRQDAYPLHSILHHLFQNAGFTSGFRGCLRRTDVHGKSPRNWLLR